MNQGRGSLVLRAYCAAVLLFLALPVIVAVGVAFGVDRIARFPPTALSLRWFAVALADEAFMGALRNSIYLAVVTTLVAVLLSIPACLALVRGRLPAQNTVEAFLLSPLTLPWVIIGLSILLLLGMSGFGLTWWGLLAGHVVVAVPYALKTVLAVYRGLDYSIEESAMVLGASPLRTFWHVTLPLIRPGLVAGGLFAFLVSFDNVPISIFLTTSETTTLPITVLSYLINEDFDAVIGAVSAIQVSFVLFGLFVVDRIYGVNRLTSVGAQ